jgi:hypothetical protein
MSWLQLAPWASVGTQAPVVSQNLFAPHEVDVQLVAHFMAGGVAQRPLSHGLVLGVVQAPAPLHTVSVVISPPVQLAAVHTTVLSGKTHAVAFVPSHVPLQLPLPPHSVREPTGSPEMVEHCPTLPDALHDWHCPSQVPSQHTPSMQWSLAHSPSPPHAVPKSASMAPWPAEPPFAPEPPFPPVVPASPPAESSEPASPPAFMSPLPPVSLAAEEPPEPCDDPPEFVLFPEPAWPLVPADDPPPLPPLEVPPASPAVRPPALPAIPPAASLKSRLVEQPAKGITIDPTIQSKTARPLPITENKYCRSEFCQEKAASRRDPCSSQHETKPWVRGNSRRTGTHTLSVSWT